MYTMHFYHIYLPFSPSSFPRAHLTSIPPDFMFCHFVNTSLSPLSVPTIYIVNGHGASTGACAWYQWPHPHGKILPPQQPWTGNGSSQLRGGGSLMCPTTHAGMLCSLIFCKSRAGNHRCCELASVTATSYPEDNISQTSSHFPVPTFFPLPLLWCSLSIQDWGQKPDITFKAENLESLILNTLTSYESLHELLPLTKRSFSDQGWKEHRSIYINIII